MRIRSPALLAASAAAALLSGCTPAPPEPTATLVASADPASTPAPPVAVESTDGEDLAPDGDGRAYEQCPDALVDAWLHLGTGDDVTVDDFGPRAVGWGSQPTGDAAVHCAVALDGPSGEWVHVLTVLTGERVPDAVLSAAAEQGMDAVPSGQTGAVAAYTASGGAITYTLFGPPDRVLSMSGMSGAGDAYLLEGALSVEAR